MLVATSTLFRQASFPFVRRCFARPPTIATTVDSLVAIDHSAIPHLLPWIIESGSSTAWRDYVGSVSTSDEGLVRLFHELALTVSQFGGFVDYRSDGTKRVWKHDGSGVKAILKVMQSLRFHRVLPGIDIHADVSRHLACHFLGVPFADERLQILTELANPSARSCFERILTSARRADGRYVFNVLHMMALRTTFPRSFGGDGPYAKKASLLLMTLEIALRDLGFEASAYTIPPADYRIPQVLEGLGILQFRPDLAKQIAAGRIFALDAPEVRAIRTATVRAVDAIRKCLLTEGHRPMSTADLDSCLYLLSRNEVLMSRTTMRPHMMVATLAF